jgi:hypothetical protein
MGLNPSDVFERNGNTVRSPSRGEAICVHELLEVGQHSHEGAKSQQERRAAFGRS